MAAPVASSTQPAKTTSSSAWEPKRHLQRPQPPVVDDKHIHDLELAVQRQLLDGKALKRRVLGGWPITQGPWVFREPSPRYVPYIRPNPPYVIELLPPKPTLATRQHRPVPFITPP